MKAAATVLDRYWLLDHVAGWRVALNRGLELTKPDGNLILDPLPGGSHDRTLEGRQSVA